MIRPDAMNKNAFDFTQFQRIMEGWPLTGHELANFTVFSDGILERIHQVLTNAYQHHSQPCFPDLLPLIRQATLKRTYRGNPIRLRLNATSGWPERHVWQSFGFACHDSADNRITSPAEWHPDWLPIPNSFQSDIFSDCFNETEVRLNGEIPIDPFIGDLTGYDNYVCPGQKEAVLSALFMPHGSTLIVNLPTGAGKTLVAQAPILMNGLNKGLSIFVVPTTALAIDQARRMKELLERKIARLKIPPLAWHGQLSDHDRELIKNNIKQGQQGIVFASPEAVTGALAPSIYSAAKSGLLRYLIVDEAHLISQWGDGFRPAFQSLAGLRCGLLDNSNGENFRTILMSATFSPDSIETLDKLFGPSENVQMVSAVHLRPEPRYWAANVDDEDTKRERILDTLKHAPRPFILYVTERKDAYDWERVLKAEQGYERVATFTGDTTNRDREEIINDWAKNRIDGIVATSAFGVGIDKSDVRSVVHATVPESLDRFYQEVGRGGRDGNASLSITVFSPRDVRIAKKMAEGVRHSNENAFSRWRTMFKKSRLEGDHRILDLRLTPPHLPQQTELNESWNMRTLILMARAGLIELTSSPPEAIERWDEEDDTAFEERINARWDDYYAEIPVRTLDPQHLMKDHFHERIAAEKDRNAKATRASLDTLLNALRGEREMGEALASAYESYKPGREIIVSQVCRGCPAQGRTVPVEELIYQMPIEHGITRIIERKWDYWVRDIGGDAATLFIYYQPGLKGLSAELEQALGSLIALYGVSELAAPKALWDRDNRLRNLYRREKLLVRRDLEAEQDPSSTLPLPRATLLLPWDQKPIPDSLDHLDRPLNAIFLPEDIKAAYDHKKLVEISTNCMSINKFLEKATQ